MAPVMTRRALIAVLLGSLFASVAGAQERVAVTVRQLFDQGHRIKVAAGGEVVWADPHFDRVWFPAGGDAPAVERMPGGYRARFTKPGSYRGAFTVTAGHATNDVYSMTVQVTPR
jgi:hypothetical protein